MLRPFSLLAMTALLAGCTGGSPIPRERIERALVGAPGLAQPTKVVARELEFARMAKEDGQWTAFRAFAAPGAIIHGRKGPVDAQAWLSGLKDPAEAVRWSPDTVWMSCDSKLAVSEGRFRDPKGMVGSFVTVWQRQSDDEYLWIYDVAVLDDPQPVRREAEPIPDDAIIVEAMESIRGLVADCPMRGKADAKPSPPPFTIADGTDFAVGFSPDGTLRWRWEHPAQGKRRFTAEYLTSGRWETALDQPLGQVSAE